MGKTLGQILMDEARQTGLQEWMKKVQVAVRQTDVKNPVTWTALERLSRDEDNMPRLMKLLKEHCPCPSLKTQEEPAYLILAAYHNDNDSLGYLLDTMKEYIKKKDHDGILFLCRMQAAINDNEDYPHLNGLYNELTGYLLSCRRDRVKEYRKGNIPVFSEADLQVAEKYLPHLKEYSFRDKVMAVFPTAKTVTELAEKCGCAVNTFERRFKEEFGAAPRKWMVEQKAKRVVTLLTHTNLPMKEIAGDCGFESSGFPGDQDQSHRKCHRDHLHRCQRPELEQDAGGVPHLPGAAFPALHHIGRQRRRLRGQWHRFPQYTERSLCRGWE